MKDATLLRTSLIVSAVGILLLFFISNSVSIEEIKADKFEEYKDEIVKISGIVEQVSKTETATFMKVKQPCVATVVVFEPLNITKGNYIMATGKVDEYGDEFELLADKVQVR